MSQSSIHLPPIDMPVNVEAEQYVLGALMMKNAVFAEISSFLEEWHFAIESHQQLFGVLKTMIGERKLANPVTIKNTFANSSIFEELGGARYLMQLCGAVPSILNVSDYARCIVDCAFRREIIHNSLEAIQGSVDGDRPAEEVAAENMASMGKLKTGGNSFLTLDTAIDEVIYELDHPETFRCFPTGMRRVDSMLGGGLYGGKFYGVGARGKVGKTSFLLSLSYSLLFNRTKPVPHLYVCMEMGAKEISQRLLARHMGINSEAFLEMLLRREAYVQGKWTSCGDLANRVRAAKAEMREKGLTFQQRPRLSLDGLKHAVSSAAMSGKCEGVIVDYLQMVTGRQKHQSMSEHLDNVAQTLVETSKQTGMWIMAAAQTNREGLIRGGDGLFNACDMAMNLHRKPDGAGGYKPEGWIEMTASRFTPYRHLGTEQSPGLILDERVGPYFREFEAASEVDEL